MRKLMTAFVIASVGGVAVVRLAANHNPGRAPFDFVVGSGVSPHSLGDVRISVAAHETPAGPIGHITIDEPDGHFDIDVVCLVVSDNQAMVGGKIVGGPDIYIGAGYLLWVTDNAPNSGEADIVRIARVPVPPDPSFQCDLSSIGQPSVSGNFTVHDAQ